MGEFEIREHHSWDRPRPKWRRRLLLGSLIIVLLCVAIPCGYFLISGSRDLANAFAEADRLDPGWGILELEQKRAVIPDEENSGLVIVAAKKLLPAKWPLWNFPEVPGGSGERRTWSEADRQRLQKSLGEIEPPVQLD